MTMINSVGNVLASDKLSKYATGATATVLIMTGIKAVARPAFIYADNKSDPETKKYTATKEFLYQMLCLGITFLMLPAFKKLGFKMAENYVKNDETAAKILEKANEVKSGFLKNIYKSEKISAFANEAKSILNKYKETGDKSLEHTVNAIHAGNGGAETGSLVGSVLGLTVLAPMISHEVLHPIMSAIGMDKKQESKPAENKVDAKA